MAIHDWVWLCITIYEGVWLCMAKYDSYICWSINFWSWKIWVQSHLKEKNRVPKNKGSKKSKPGLISPNWILPDLSCPVFTYVNPSWPSKYPPYKHPSDTFPTPSRHFLDTFQTLQTLSGHSLDAPQTPSRQHIDTAKKPLRHSKDTGQISAFSMRKYVSSGWAVRSVGGWLAVSPLFNSHFLIQLVRL